MTVNPTGIKGLSLAQQNYVECIADAEARHGHAHVSLLAEELEISKPSVVEMLGRLLESKIVRRQDKEVVLTATGRRIARELGGRHALLRDFMVKELRMERRTADADACRMEHVVSPSFVRSLRRFREDLAYESE
jgi:DtxR family Mn-dependent transcriptional regulator